MEYFFLGVIAVLVLVFAAYTLGHWTGYGKAEDDLQEFSNAQAVASAKNKRNAS